MEKLEKILMEIYTKVYAEIGVDFNQLIQTDLKQDWFLEYQMPAERQEEIFREVISKYKLSKYQIRTLSINYHLGVSPTSKKYEHLRTRTD